MCVCLPPGSRCGLKESRCTVQWRRLHPEFEGDGVGRRVEFYFFAVPLKLRNLEATAGDSLSPRTKILAQCGRCIW